MPIRGERKYTFTPVGLTDSVDGTLAPPGSLQVCADLVISPSDGDMLVPRPAAVKVFDISSINPNGVISCFLQLGDFVYGMISSTTYPGKDQPFAGNLKTGGVFTVSGVSSALLPTSQSNVGDWVEPTMTAIGGRVIVTHPGFPGGTGPYIGWFDISSFTSTSYSLNGLGNVTNGSPIITGIRSPIGTANPIGSGYEPGMLIFGSGIPANAYIVSMTNGTFSLNTTGTTSTATNTITALASTTGILPGMAVSGPGIPAGAYISSVSGSTITFLTGNAVVVNSTASAAGVAVNFSGGGSITISANATTTSQVSFSVQGGTPAAPMWGAGNTNTNGFVTVPVACAGFNGRCWYAAGQYAIYSDILNPTQVSLASQAVAVGDPTAITALTSVPLTSQLTGGVQQSLTVYKGAGNFFQITGDAATSSLALNDVTGSVGTQAPGTITQSPTGIVSISQDGMRLIGLTGTQGPVIGSYGTGVVAPFTTGVLTSRMNADYASDVYRVAVASVNYGITGYAVGSVEYWYHMEAQRWTGPHSFPSQLVQASSDKSTFFITSWFYPAAIFRSDTVPGVNSTFTEAQTKTNNNTLQWTMTATPLPDNDQLAYIQITRANLACSLSTISGMNITITSNDPSTNPLVYYMQPAAGIGALWGSMVWDFFYWGGHTSPFLPRPIIFDAPVVCRQPVINIQPQASAYGQKIGNLVFGYKFLGYNSPVMQ